MAIHLPGVANPDSERARWQASRDSTNAAAQCVLGNEPLSATPRPSVSIVVAARNNGAYLEDALRSALSQSFPCEVIYVDDGSEDDSVEIAARFPGVRTIPRPREGVCAARNWGLAESRGEFLVFLDGDDQLPYRYVESALRALDARSSFSYSPAQAFGLVNYFWDVPDWDGSNIWARNFVHTSALHRRADLLAVGGWQEGIGTAWDWNLALRYARAGCRGQPVRDNFLMYRQHPHSFSRRFRQRADADIPANARFFWLTRHALSRFQIGLVLSDRVFDLFAREWLPAVRRNLEHYRARMAEEEPCGPLGRVEPRLPALEIAYTGQRRLLDVHRVVDRFADDFCDVQVTRMSFATPLGAHGDVEGEPARRSHLSVCLAAAYNRLLDSPSEVVWFLEDDVIPPDHAYYHLVRTLLGADDVNAKFAVSGCYRNRHAPQWYVLADWPSDDPQELRHYERLGETPFYVDVSGTGCLAIFRPFAPHRFDSHVGKAPAHDWAWCRRLAQYTEAFRPAQRKVLALPSVVCRHYQDNERFV